MTLPTATMPAPPEPRPNRAAPTETAPNPWVKVGAAVAGTGVLLMILVIAFALPAARSAPHGVPIGAVGTPEQLQAFERSVTGFDVHIYASEGRLRMATLDREVYGGLVLTEPTGVDVLYATAASPAVAALIQGVGTKLATATGRQLHPIELRPLPERDPKGVGLAAGALPLALGGWLGAMVIMLLVPDPRRRALAALGVAVAGGLAVVGCLQFVIGTFDGSYPLTALAGMFGIAAACFIVLGLRELLGGPGLGIAAVLLVLLGNPLSGLASAPELLPSPWGRLGQLLPPGATGSLLRSAAFFDGKGALQPLVTLTGYLIVGVGLYVMAVYRAARTGTVDVDRIEFDHRPREFPPAPMPREDAAGASAPVPAATPVPPRAPGETAPPDPALTAPWRMPAPGASAVARAPGAHRAVSPR